MNINRYRPTERFTAKARFYERRPDYPAEIAALLRRDLGFEPGHVVADVGAGTGKLSKVFVGNGNRVFALEPNAVMRAALREKFTAAGNLTILDRPAEATGLPDASVDLIAAGQAFHWFDLEKAKLEFTRVLKIPGFLLVASNDPVFTDVGLAARLKEITEKYFFKNEKRIDFTSIDHRAFFAPFPPTDAVVTGTVSREPETVFEVLRSHSFCPEEDDPSFEAMRVEFLDALHAAAVDGVVALSVNTVLTYGRMK